jgi:hypothetical protein
LLAQPNAAQRRFLRVIRASMLVKVAALAGLLLLLRALLGGF